jgi:hypothetical protein
LISVISLASFPVLYRRAIPTIQAVERERINDPYVLVRAFGNSLAFKAIKEMAAANVPQRAPRLQGAALFNLRAVLGFLALGRTLVSGLLLSLAVFVIGLVLITRETTQSLMNSQSIGVPGWSKTLHVGGFQFFASEALAGLTPSVGTVGDAADTLAPPIRIGR